MRTPLASILSVCRNHRERLRFYGMAIALGFVLLFCRSVGVGEGIKPCGDPCTDSDFTVW